MRTIRIIASIIVASLQWTAGTVLAQDLRWPALHPFEPAPFNMDLVQEDDQRRALAGELELYARTLPLSVNSWSDGEWTNEDQERVCRILVRSRGAQAMELLLEQVVVPPGASLRLVQLDGRALSEAMPLAMPDQVEECSSPMVFADEVVIEYRQPMEAPFEGRFAINGLVHAYRYVNDMLREGPCHVNVECEPESNGWEDVIRSTVRISVVVPEGNGWCTGTLVNNVRQDCAPYILTAYHCGRTSTTAQFNQYKFYFNFQYANCSGGAYSTNQFLTGAQRKAYSDDYVIQYQGLGGSDFMLLRTNTEVPDAYQAYWSGWDATNVASVSADGVCIHHPTGAPKRISTYTQTLTTGHPMTSSGLMSHYKAKWAATQNGHGVTEYGSSGGGLFKPHVSAGPVLIGTLTGSSTGMTCTNNTGTAYFGKMSYHWTNNPNSTALKLKPWLDPDGTGTLVLAGSPQPCSLVAAVAELERTASLVIAPNPTAHEVRLEWAGKQNDTFETKLFDATGREVYSSTTKSLSSNAQVLDVSFLSDGFYSLLILQGEQRYAGRLVVVH